MKVIFLRSGAIDRGKRGLLRLLSGGWTQNGKRTELMNVMAEKTTSERLPTRPTSPRMSFHCADPFGTSYRK